MPIDHILEKIWKVTVHYWGIVADTPTHFEHTHWMIFTSICVVIGCLCMRGFGSRKDY